MIRHGFFTIAIVIGISALNDANAQELFAKVGTSISRLDWKPEQTYTDWYIGPYAKVGSTFRYRQNNHLSAEIGFIKKGGSEAVILRDDTGNEIGTKTINTAFNYFSLAAYYNRELIDTKFQLNVYGGPRIDYIFGYDDAFKSLESDLNPIQPGVDAGFNLTRTLGDLRLGLDVAYLLAILPIAKWEASDIRPAGEIRDLTFSASVMVTYML